MRATKRCDIGSAMSKIHTIFSARSTGPHPYPMMVRDSNASSATKRASKFWRQEGRLPDASSLVSAAAAMRSGSSIRSSRMSRQADRRGSGGRRSGNGRACGNDDKRPSRRVPRIAELCAQDEFGQVQPAHSISAGLDYPGIGPEHAWLERYRTRGIRADHGRGGIGCASAC